MPRVASCMQNGPWPTVTAKVLAYNMGSVLSLKYEAAVVRNMVTRVQFTAVACLLAALLLASSLLFATAKQSAEGLSPVELVRQAVNNEVASNRESNRHFMFKDVKKTAHLNQVKLIVETKEATAGLLIANDGHPLSPEERKQEEARLQNYVRNPQELNKKRKQEKEDAEHTMRILQALPDAFLYQPDGSERGTEVLGRSGHELVRLKFRPNPDYDPPSRVEQVLTGMTGYLLVDVPEKRIAQINATLEKDVGFGWGILGHLDRGGRFLVQQADIGDRHWELTRMELSMTGKILLVKKLSIQSSDTFSDFHPVPADLTFAQGVEMLKQEADRASNARSRPLGRASERKQPSEEKAEVKTPGLH
jgi:hypothetical protein